MDDNYVDEPSLVIGGRLLKGEQLDDHIHFCILKALCKSKIVSKDNRKRMESECRCPNPFKETAIGDPKVFPHYTSCDYCPYMLEAIFCEDGAIMFPGTGSQPFLNFNNEEFLNDLKAQSLVKLPAWQENELREELETNKFIEKVCFNKEN